MPLALMGQYIYENSDSLALEIVGDVVSKMKLEIPKWERENAIEMYKELFRFLGQSLESHNSEQLPQFLIKWSQANAKSQAEVSHGQLSVIALRYSPTREILTDLITELSLKYELSIKEFSNVIKQVNLMLDLSITETVIAYEEYVKNFRDQTSKELTELSAPLVPVKDGTVIIPLIGNFDYNRIAYLSGKLILKIVEQDIQTVLVDLSGVLTLEEELAHSLHNLGIMLKLMDIKVIFTGISPDMARIAVHNSIEFGEAKTYGTLKQALVAMW